MIPGPDNFGSTHETIELVVDGLVREYVAYVPANAKDAAPLAMVMRNHGGGGTAKTAATATRLSRYAADRGFLAIYPQATRKDPLRPVTFLRNPTFWNVGSGFGHAERLKIDDVSYIRGVLSDVQRRWRIDERRRFVAGFSNGAALAMKLGVELSEQFSAVCAVAGHLWDRHSRPVRPLSLLYVIGDRDPIVPPDGGEVSSPWGGSFSLPPVRESIEAWAGFLDCPLTPVQSAVEPGVMLERYGPNARGAGVDFYRIADAGHVWPGGEEVLAERIAGPRSAAFDATRAMLEFFGL